MLDSSYKLEVTKEAAPGAVSVEEIRAHLQLGDECGYDAQLLQFEAAARQTIESITGRIYRTTEYKLYLDQFPWKTFSFPVGPVDSLSIEYLTGGVLTPVDAEIYKLGRGTVQNQQIYLVDGQQWPTDQDDEKDNVVLTFQAGKRDYRLKQAIKLLVGHWFIHREAVSDSSVFEVPKALDMLIKNLKDYGVT